MSRPGGWRGLGDLGRQLADMLEQATRDLTMPPYAEPEAPPMRGPLEDVREIQGPRPARLPEAPPLEVTTPDEELAGFDEVAPRPPRAERRRPARRAGSHAGLRAQLRSKPAVRRAILMSEILGPPRALQEERRW